MTASDLIAATTISQVWAALGGDQPRHRRAKAFWRDGDGLSVSLDDAKGCWHDFRDSVGGGILDLIRHVLGGTRLDALHWLSKFTGLRLDEQAPTAMERAEYASRRARARRKARDVIHWRKAFVDELNAAKISAAEDGNDDALERSATLCNVLENGGAADVVREYNRHRTGDPIEVTRLVSLGAKCSRNAAFDVALNITLAAE